MRLFGYVQNRAYVIFDNIENYREDEEGNIQFDEDGITYKYELLGDGSYRETENKAPSFEEFEVKSDESSDSEFEMFCRAFGVSPSRHEEDDRDWDDEDDRYHDWGRGGGCFSWSCGGSPRYSGCGGGC